MKTDDPLDQLLSEWQVRADVPTDFRRAVWQTISRTVSEPTLFEKVAWWLLQPRQKIIALAAAVVVGIGVALALSGSEEISPHDAYVMSISPFDPHHPFNRDR